ncbi:dihydroorotase [Patescibacteria group bacterium]|nr:dihydroorotase [Patescibacteria group bacterium]MBU0963887.1 dihydroorotase [Patescibacteria group bacterium]
MSSTNLKNCQLANGEKTDILIADGKIQDIGPTLSGDKAIDIGGKLVIPGVIDAHVHFREPGGEKKEDWTSGSQAAATGGVTSVIDMPNNNPAIINKKTLGLKRDLAQKSLVNYGFYLGATKNNHDEIKTAPNIAGVKIYVGSSTGDLLVDQDEDIAKLFSIPDIQWVIHAEDEKIITSNAKKMADVDNPAIHSEIRERKAAIKAVKRIIKLASQAGARVHICHISTKEEIELIKKAKENKLNITCEVSPHHLFLNRRAYKKFGNLVKVNPPLREIEDNEALWQAINDGIIDIIATDHAPHVLDEKWQDYNKVPSGIPEVQTSLPLMMNEVSQKNISLEKLIQIMCQQPAEIFKLKNKGQIMEGYDADLTVIDQVMIKTINKSELKSKCSWSPYEGWELKGWPIMTFVNGNLVYNNGKINDQLKGRELNYGKI